MSNFEQLFYDYEARRQGVIIVELPLIEPIPDLQVKLADLLLQAGIDIIEVGVPVRFPWMYGTTILKLQKNARDKDIDWKHSFEIMERIREKHPEAEIMPVGFYGGMARMGQKRYLERCKELYIRAIDIPDYPLAADGDPFDLQKNMKKKGMGLITVVDFNLALVPENSKHHPLLERIVKKSLGFTFLLAVSGGKTGEKSELPLKNIGQAKRRIEKIQDKYNKRCPIVVVCGISTPEHVRAIVKDIGAHVMFGSALFKRVMGGESDEKILKFLSGMKEAAM
ncbi:tryptophan synthase subunit alpha [candidate division WOR-3 bacterium]|nr:tryptophan synthase subunit alpha [candidate division WOR-3 bacterium]